MIKGAIIIIALFLFSAGFSQPAIDNQYDVLIVGGSTGGAAAAIQSARSGAKTLLVEPGSWLGGMLTAAGVGCTDGNHKLPSGIWNEFREAAFRHYRTRNLATGWVSNFNIEPHVGDSILKAFAFAEKKLTILFNAGVTGVSTRKLTHGGRRITGVRVTSPDFTERKVEARVYVDATDLGDFLAMAGSAYDVGIEKDAAAGEIIGININAPIVQDMTYAAILKDFGAAADKTIPRPVGYHPMEFDCACSSYCSDPKKLFSQVDARKMLQYGKMPNGKFMINWPAHGNDFYSNIIELNAVQRSAALDSAKQKTLRFIYFIQTTLGFKNLGLADDEFTTADKLPFMAYHREGRRVAGLVRLTIPHIKNPYDRALSPLYRTGISVGDYPVDHHHREYGPGFPDMKFPPVPSYNIPAGALISKSVSNLMVCDKPISVSNAANGTTRLQPVVMLTGQAAGLMAAQAATENISPSRLSIRSIQMKLMECGVFIMPYLDVSPTHRFWQAIQRVGASGFLRGTGKPDAWANQTWFYPDSLLLCSDFNMGLESFGYPVLGISGHSNHLTIEEFERYLKKTGAAGVDAPLWLKSGLENYDRQRFMTRGEAAVLIDYLMNPFWIPVNWDGNFIGK